MGYTYTLNGETHTMSGAEAEAIERSGPPHRVQDYAMGLEVRTCGEHAAGALSLGIRLAESRPVAIEPGLRRTMLDELSTGKGRPWNTMKKGMMHLSVVRGRDTHKACGGHAVRGETFGAKVFVTMIDHERVCKACVVAYYADRIAKLDETIKARDAARAERADPDADYVKPLNWTKEELKRLREYREKGDAESSKYESWLMTKRWA